MLNIQFDLVQVHEVAQYIWDHNPAVKMWPGGPTSPIDVVNIILEHGKTTAIRNMTNDDDSWTSWSQGGGYLLVFTNDVNDTVEVGVFLDPSIGKQNQYVRLFADN